MEHIMEIQDGNDVGESSSKNANSFLQNPQKKRHFGNCNSFQNHTYGINQIRMRFVDETLEADYSDFYSAKKLRVLRIAAIFGMVLLAIFFVLDFLSIADARIRNIVIGIRTSTILITFATFGLSFWRKTHGFIFHLFAALFVMIAGAFVAIVWVANNLYSPNVVLGKTLS